MSFNFTYGDPIIIKSGFGTTENVYISGDIITEGDIKIVGTTTLNAAVSTEEYLTLTVNGSALALQLYK